MYISVMKRYLTILLLFAVAMTARAQRLVVSSMRSAPNDITAAAATSRRIDPNGEACALIKISTRQSGFSFDAGMNCIVDILYNEPGIWLYIPSGTRNLTISHKEFGTLRNWPIPFNLEPARTYEMTLKGEMPRPSNVSYKPKFNVEGFSSHFLESHVGTAIWDGEFYGMTVGLNYSFIPKHAGFYTSVEYSTELGAAFFIGPEFRIFDNSSTTDWHLYGGIGLQGNGAICGDIGSKFGWRDGHTLSRWDFSLGCQYWGDGIIVPYAGVGAGITGYTALGALGLICLCLGAVL